MYSMVWLKPEHRYAGVQRARQGDQDTDIQLNSSPEEDLKMNLHIVSRPACHRTMKEGSVIADCKRVDNKTCSVLQLYRIITLRNVQ